MVVVVGAVVDGVTAPGVIANGIAVGVGVGVDVAAVAVADNGVIMLVICVAELL